MFRLPYIILLAGFLFIGYSSAQSPHGEGLKLDCSVCHNPNNWKVNIKETKFEHSTTSFSLIGQHTVINCQSCHAELIFTKAQSDCSTCHKDIHQETVGLDCSKCHTPVSWMVKDFNRLHQELRFPLTGTHSSADCAQCHTRYTDLYFEPLDLDCYSCHKDNYNSTASPNHSEAGFSTDCMLCHSINSDVWAASSIIHDFFPLVGGHTIQDCFACHEQGGNFSGLSQNCYSCHQQDYENVQDPNHLDAGFPTDCLQCHTINGWSPATFNHDITGFQLTGKHNTIDCSDCHSDGFSGTPTECFDCHQQDYETVTDPDHVSGNFPTTCEDCHSTSGWTPATFDHSQTNFPLTGAHIALNCNSCHSDGFEGTPSDCIDCHQQDYDSVQDPNHVDLGFPTDCTQCHSTSSWDGADFDHSLTGFELTGAHINTDCLSCHTDGFEGTSSECFSCHDSEYNNANDPDHIAANFPTTCEDCHSTSGWTPATFDHDGQYFPIYSGEHRNKWDDCNECHTVPSDFSQFSCIDCHEHRQSKMDSEHQGVSGYIYESNACFSCHPTGDKEGAFNHDVSNFPLTGSHIGLDCLDCHESGFENTPIDCGDCHQQEYDNSTNPDHQVLSLSTDCETCHTTNSDWQPAEFPIHDQFYLLDGEHQQINDCGSCHNGDYNNTADECFGCHESDYNNTNDPDHIAANFPNACEECHSTDGWTPATFDHDGQYFPIYTGEHRNKWDNCDECHTIPNDFSQFSCIDCHEHRQSEMDNEHQGVEGYVYESNACFSCHPTGEKDGAFDHGTSDFPLTGAHVGLDCLACHESGFENTPIDCVACHQQDYDNSTNPNHQELSLQTGCETCHSTNPDWLPAEFPAHDLFFLLEGAHQQINDCGNCHNGDYNNTPSECFGCHETDYNGAPDHLDQSFPTECDLCHTVNNWEENSFDHSNTNFPLTGAHQNVDCNNCHESGYTGTTTICYDCHQTNYEQTTNPDHQALSLATDCEDCHTTNPNWQPAEFPIHNQFYELIGAHANISNCNDCHNSNFNNTPNTCFECHESEYNDVNNPPHLTLNFSHDCLECHNQNDWEPANFIHDFFPLSNDHSDVDCNECHSEPNYNPQCMSCHEGDFLDEHNFGDPTDCWSCHTTFDWDTGGGMLKLKRVN